MASGKSGEFRGKTVEMAISAGLAALSLTREEVEVQVVRPGSRGLLGIGAEDAIVRLTAPAPAQAETRPEVHREARAEFPARQSPAPVPQAPITPAAVAGPEVVSGAAGGVRAPRPEAATSGAEAEGARRARQPRPGEGRRGEQRPPQVVAAEPAAPAGAGRAPQAGVAADGAGDTDDLQRGRTVLLALLERMDLKADVEIVPQSEAESEDEERSLVLNIVGEDLGGLIGRQSEVLSALQFLVRLMVNQESRSRSDLVVDVNGYKAKRAESLRKLAIRTADQVTQTGRTMALEPMSPAERRIVHLALRNHASVSTLSVGEGTRRKVTVVPKK